RKRIEIPEAVAVARHQTLMRCGYCRRACFLPPSLRWIPNSATRDRFISSYREAVRTVSWSASKEWLMDLKSTVAGALIAVASVATALAQQSTTSEGTTITSEPGRASVVRTQEGSAEVVRIDKPTRTVTLRGTQGNTFDIVAGDQVKNFDQIKVGDIVVARYTQALALKLRKTKGPPEDVSVSEGSTQAKPGEQPSFTGGR